MGRKRNPERRESSIKEFRAEILAKGPGNGGSVSGPSVSTEINTLNQLYKSTSDTYQSKLAAAIKIKQMEQTGVFTRDDIDKAKKELGLSGEGATVGGPGSKQTAKDLLMMQIANEQDRDKQTEMIQTLANIETIEKSGGAMSPLMLNLMNRPQGAATKKNTFEEKLMDKLADHLFKEPKSELDNLDKIAELMKKVQEMQGPTDGIDKIAEDVKKYKEIGLVRDTAQSENEMKLEIEKLRIDNQYKIEEHKIEADKQRTDSLTNVVGDVIGSALSAAGAAAGSKGGTSAASSKSAIRPETMQSSYEATCAKQGCGAKILVTNIDQARDISCPSCNQTYHLDSKDKKLYMIEETPPGPTTPTTA